MKKIIFTVMAMAAVLLMAGCPTDPAPALYNVGVSPAGAESGESVSISPVKAAEGDIVTLTAALNSGRKVALSAPGISITPEVIVSSGGTATFTMPASAVTITAIFSNLEAGDAVEHTAGSVSFDMHLVPNGSFDMGYTGVATPVHNVTLTKNFWLGETEVTQGLWEAVWDGWPGTDPASQNYGDGVNYPAYFVNWYDTVAFCNLLTVADESIADNQQIYYLATDHSTAYTKEHALASTPPEVWADWSKKGYRLPTEAEWEYAARYIDGTDWNGGDHISGDTSAPCNTSTVIGDYAWYIENSGDNGGTTNLKSHEVGQKFPNALGLKDMSGNVWEWCYDWRANNYSGGSQSDPIGPESGSNRVMRGGGWDYSATYLRCADRDHDSPSYTSNSLGFRLCRTAD